MIALLSSGAAETWTKDRLEISAAYRDRTDIFATIFLGAAN